MTRLLPKGLFEPIDNGVLLTVFDEQGNIFMKSSYKNLPEAQDNYTKIIKDCIDSFKEQKAEKPKKKQEDEDE